MIRLTRQQAGFTIIELMIATMIFAGILLGATTALLQINKLYFGGVTTTKTQEVTRQVINDISRQIQFTNDQPLVKLPVQVSPTTQPDKLKTQALCVGNIRYSYAIDAQVNSDTLAGHWNATGPDADHHLKHALWRDTISSPGPGGCVSLDLSQDLPTGSSSDGQELLASSMRLSRLDAGCSSTASHYCSVTIQVIFGDDDLIARDSSGNPTGCKSIVGSQWCAVSELSTSVYQRVHSGS